MPLSFKFEVDWLNGSKYIAFTMGIYSIQFEKFDGSHLDLSRWPKINSVRPLGNMKTNF